MRQISCTLHRAIRRAVTRPSAWTLAALRAFNEEVVRGGLEGFSCDGTFEEVYPRAKAAITRLCEHAGAESRLARATGEDLYTDDRHHYHATRSLKHIPARSEDEPNGFIEGDTATCRKRFYVRKDGEWVCLGLDDEVWRAYSEEHGYVAASCIVTGAPEPAPKPNPLQGEVDHLRERVGEQAEQIAELQREVDRWQHGTLAALALTEEARAAEWTRLCDFDPMEPQP